MGHACCSQANGLTSLADANGAEPIALDGLVSIDDQTKEEDATSRDIVKGILEKAEKERQDLNASLQRQAAESIESDDDIDAFFGLKPPGVTPCAELQGAGHNEVSSTTKAEQSSPSNDAADKASPDCSGLQKDESHPPGNERKDEKELGNTGAPEAECKGSDKLPSELPKLSLSKSVAHEERKKTGSVVKKSSANATEELKAPHMLQELDAQVKELAASVSQIGVGFSAGQIVPGKARTDLAQLEAKLNKVQCKDIDGLNLSSLESGKEEARAIRRGLIKRTEALFEEIDQLFERITSGNGQRDLPTIDETAMAARDSDRKSDLLLDCPSACASYTGRYSFCPGVVLNGKPSWQRQGGSQILYFTKLGIAFVASKREAAERGTGAIRSTASVLEGQAWESVKWSTFARERKKWIHDSSIIAKTVRDAIGSVKSARAKDLLEVAQDPYNLRRFCQACHDEFDVALAEIKAGKKVGCWSWYFFPVAPWVVDGVEKGSQQNQSWCLRDRPPNQMRGDDAARAFLRFEAHGVSLRDKYITMMTEVTKQIACNIPPNQLVGGLDEPKLRSSLRLFERVSRGGFDEEVNRVCRRALEELKEQMDK